MNHAKVKLFALHERKPYQLSQTIIGLANLIHDQP